MMGKILVTYKTMSKGSLARRDALIRRFIDYQLKLIRM